MHKITPHLWFDTAAREAAELYVSALPESRITALTTLTDTPSGDCDVVAFELAGQPLMAISAGPLFRPNPSISFQISGATAGEVDALWNKLQPGGKVLMPLDAYPFSPRFGWIEDKYGFSWQVMHSAVNAQRVTPMLIFTGNVAGRAEEAANFYASTFKSAPDAERHGSPGVNVLSRYGASDAPDKEGTVKYGRVSLLGGEFAVMDSAHDHKFAFNEAVSLMVPCDTQDEIDYLWERLSADPSAEQCGWLKDKYGVSWQITPTAMQEIMRSGDRARIDRVTQAFLPMKKFDIATLERAAARR